MITAYNVTNVADYKALFAEAADILSGYTRVRTFELKSGGDGTPATYHTYYYKNDKPTSVSDMYLPIEGEAKSLTAFAEKLKKYQILYTKNDNYEVPEAFDPMAGITTLEEYFSWIATLGKINRKYTVLPLDEEYFEIDANTRAINIPASYKKNGIAVQGDDLAEVVYFKIDRYFDYTDLNTTDIFIQWETPKGADGKSIKSVSEAYVRDIESEPGKLIFGWAISDALTSTPGNLKFSVRFFKWINPEAQGKKELAYSFSTLTATVPIQPSINLNIEEIEEEQIDSCGERLIARLENSVVAGGYAAALPIYYTNLAPVYELNADGECKLSVLAMAPDTGSISYAWKKYSLNPDNTIKDEAFDITNAINEYVPVADSHDELKTLTLVDCPYTLYCPVSTENGVTRYVWYTEGLPISDANKADPEFMLYKKYSTVTIKHSGEATEAGASGVYYAVATNRITNSVNELKSDYAYFYRPQDIEFEANGQPKANAWLTTKTGEADGVVSVDVVDILDDKKNPLEAYYYQWYHVADSAANVNPDEETAVAVSGATNATFTATQPGYYRVEVTAVRNGAKKTRYSNWSRVTPYAQAAQVSRFKNENNFYVSMLETTWPIVEVTETEADYYTAQWFQVVPDPTTGELLSHAITDNLILKRDDDDGLIKAHLTYDVLQSANLKGQITDGDIAGTYYAVITTHLNESSAATPFVTDAQDEMLFSISQT